MSRKLNLANAALLGRAGDRAATLFGVDDSRSLRELNMDAVAPNPLQPRQNFDEAAIAALAPPLTATGCCSRSVCGKPRPTTIRLSPGNGAGGRSVTWDEPPFRRW